MNVSGKFNLRVSSQLHQILKSEAAAHKMSLNQYVNVVLCCRNAIACSSNSYNSNSYSSKGHGCGNKDCYSIGGINCNAPLVIARAYKDDLLAIIIFDHNVNGYLNVLLVLKDNVQISRELFILWQDEVTIELGWGNTFNGSIFKKSNEQKRPLPTFRHLPKNVERVDPVWMRAAKEGRVLYAVDISINMYFKKVRGHFTKTQN